MGLHLAIEIAEHSVRFVSIRDKSIVNDFELAFSSENEQSIQAEIELALESNSSLHKDFDDYSLSWSNKRSSLVPNSIFADSSAQSIHQLCFGKDTTTNDIDYNRIAELSIVNVFDVPLWIKGFFVRRFPRIIIQHQGSHILRNIISSNAFYLKVNLILEKDFFNLIIVKHNNLEFYSFFDYSTHEDIIYHLLFALQQKEFSNEKGTLEIVKGLGVSPGIIEDIMSTLEKVKDLNQISPKVIEHFIAKSQQLCV